MTSCLWKKGIQCTVVDEVVFKECFKLRRQTRFILQFYKFVIDHFLMKRLSFKGYGETAGGIKEHFFETLLVTTFKVFFWRWCLIILEEKSCRLKFFRLPACLIQFIDFVSGVVRTISGFNVIVECSEMLSLSISSIRFSHKTLLHWIWLARYWQVWFLYTEWSYSNPTS